MTASSYRTIIKNARQNRAREIQQILDLIEHKGEKGAQVETIVAGFLRELVPQKFSFSTGFIVCSDKKRSPSSQQDIIIHDSFHNVPLHANENWGIFPIESVYATVEVKTTLTKAALRSALQANNAVRAMAESGKSYALFGRSEVAPGKFTVDEQEKPGYLPPRFFLVCYRAKSGRGDASFSTVQSWFESLSLSENAHCHGLVVLEKDWLFYRIAHAQDRPKQFCSFEQGGIERFVNKVRSNLLSFPMYPAKLDKYVE